MSTVEEIVEAIKELPREKQAEVWHRLYSDLAISKSDVANGVDQPRKVSGINYWLRSNSSLPRKRSRPRRPPISIKGKPISETVVEDRR
jgi:hypothetical protein